MIDSLDKLNEQFDNSCKVIEIIENVEIAERASLWTHAPVFVWLCVRMLTRGSGNLSRSHRPPVNTWWRTYRLN